MERENQRMRKDRKRRRSLKLLVVTLILLAIIVLAAYTHVTVTWVTPSTIPMIVLNHPDDDQKVLANTTYFNWTGSGGNGHSLWYVWYADTDVTFTSLNLRTVDTNITHNYTADAFMDGDWYWRVEITDNTTQNVSETRHFKILTNASNTFPSLSSGIVLPTAGTITTQFIYYVTFTDADNNSAVIMNVSIDGTQYAMSEDDATDVITTDGKLYTYTTTLSRGSHNYTFICSDQNATNSTSLYYNPSVSDIQITNEYPTNNSIDISLTPRCNVSITSGNGSVMDVSFATNIPDWTVMQTNSSVNNGTYYWKYLDATGYVANYYWKVFVSDGYVNISEWYNFTTVAAPTVEGGDGDGGTGVPSTNVPPPTYVEITGPESVLAKTSANYTAYCEHYLGNIFFKVTWDDGTVTDWFGPYGPYTYVNVIHTYVAEGNYTPLLEAKVGYSINIASDTTHVNVIVSILPELASWLFLIILVILICVLLYFRKDIPVFKGSIEETKKVKPQPIKKVPNKKSSISIGKKGKKTHIKVNNNVSRSGKRKSPRSHSIDKSEVSVNNYGKKHI